MHASYERNIWLFGILKIFTKRVFLPVTTVYLVIVGGLTVPQIGILATLSAIASVVSEIPTGYLADRLTRKTSIILAGLFAAIATLFYAFTPYFAGAIVAVIVESIGYSFLNGPGEALIHDTLVQLKREDDYPKVVGRAQSIGLTGNVVLVALAPLTYTIDPRLPFFIGTLAYTLLIWIAYLFVEPPRSHREKLHHNPVKDLGLNLKKFVSRYSILLFLALGLIGGLNNSSSDFTNLIFKDLGLRPEHFGFVFALGSIVGIIGGYFIHLLRNLSLRTYAIVDVLVFGLTFLITGLGHKLPYAIASFAIGMGWWRLRAILYQHQMLKLFVHSSYKATLISTYSFFIRCNEAWLPIIFVGATKSLGYYRGYSVIGLTSMVTLIPMFILALRIFNQRLVIKQAERVETAF